MAETVGETGRKEREREDASGASVRSDLVALTKARLSTLVLGTAICGYIAAARSYESFSWPQFLHMTFGTLLTAFGAAVYNQLMEVEPDALMNRTADRPLPSRRIPRAVAFIIGWLLSAFGILHLGMTVGLGPALVAAATLGIYLFIYTPMKRRSTWNTIVGGIAGALPPLIGWTAAGGSLLDAGGVFLFLLLFLWQMPHFMAINWMYREEYEKGGFVMWSNGDVTGRRTGRLAVAFSLLAALLPIFPVAAKDTAAWFLFPGIAAGGVMLWLSFVFLNKPERPRAVKLFLFTLLYLPIVLTAALFAWRPGV